MLLVYVYIAGGMKNVQDYINNICELSQISSIDILSLTFFIIFRKKMHFQNMIQHNLLDLF